MKNPLEEVNDERVKELEEQGLSHSDAIGVAMAEIIKDENQRYCHLCGSIEINGGWCTNTSCSEFTKHKK
jgi:hypothetical protein